MIQDTRTDRYLQIGDRLLARGKVKTAAAIYGRYADACRAESLLLRVRECMGDDPVAALNDLAKVERLVGPSHEARRLTAEAYERLGQREIAARYLRAAAS